MFKMINKIDLQLFSEEGFEGISEDSTPVETVTEDNIDVQTDDQIDDSQPAEELFPIKYRGEERQLTKDELINLAQQGFDYTQKTQSLAIERKLADALREMGEDPAEILERIEAQRLQEQAQQMGVDPAFYEKLNALENEVSEYRRDKTLSEQEQYLADKPFFNEWSGELKELARTTPYDLHSHYLLKLDKELPNIYSQIQQEKQSLQEQKEQIGQEAVKKYLEAKKKNQVGFTEGTGSTPVIETQTPKTFADAKANAIAFLREQMQRT